MNVDRDAIASRLSGTPLVLLLDIDGTISTIAGNGDVGNSGDGGPALSAEFNYPTLIALDSSGNIYVSDSFNYTVRLLTLTQ